ncbi:MAG: AEC family transporter [Candidatus Peregrinibacteria bacterium]|nr:AEC family transporter [Candidatus Peregrinibacteria bacterium]
MLQVLTVIAPLFLIIFATAILQKFTNLGDDWSKVLNAFALKIGLPVLIFSALSKAPFSFSEQSSLIISNSLFVVGSLLLAYLIGKILRLKNQMFATLFICFIFGNVAYLGIPVLTQTSGDKILPTATLIVAIYLFWMFTIGIGYLDYSITKSKRDILTNVIKNLFFNPLLIAVILGITIGSLKLTLPSVLLKSLDMITASVTPTVLIVIGLFIGKSKFGKLTDWFPILLFSILTLGILPAIFYFGAKLFGFSPSHFSSSIIQAAMPLAITPFALADKYKLNKNFIARSIVLSTILSVISLPFWISIL